MRPRKPFTKAVNLRIDPADWRALQQEARRRHLTTSDIAREAFRLYIAELKAVTEAQEPRGRLQLPRHEKD